MTKKFSKLWKSLYHHSSRFLCVYKDVDGTRHVFLVVEYEPAHQMSEFNLRADLLRANGGSMDIMKDVINRTTIPNGLEQKFIYNSERLMAAILLQPYGYVMENGLEFSYLTTEKAFVYLWIKKWESHNLYHHLAEPTSDAEKKR